MDASRAGFVVWLTGLSGAGKSTIGQAVAERLAGMGVDVESLDGDAVREHLSKGLGFTREDRDTNIRRIGFVAGLLARHGVAVVVSAISPYRSTRDEVRGQIGRFVEVHVTCDMDELVRRDTKGLYARALRGEVPHFTGVSDPYEAPESPEVRVFTDLESLQESVDRVLEALTERGYVPATIASNSGRKSV